MFSDSLGHDLEYPFTLVVSTPRDSFPSSHLFQLPFMATDDSLSPLAGDASAPVSGEVVTGKPRRNARKVGVIAHKDNTVFDVALACEFPLNPAQQIDISTSSELVDEDLMGYPVFVMPKVLPDVLPYDTSLPASIRPGQRYKRPLHERSFFLYYTITHVYPTTDTVLYKSDSQKEPQAFKLSQLQKLFGEGMFEFVNMHEYYRDIANHVISQFHIATSTVEDDKLGLAPSSKPMTKRQATLKQLQSNAGMGSGESVAPPTDGYFMEQLKKSRA